jgi:hypothetical protein
MQSLAVRQNSGAGSLAGLVFQHLSLALCMAHTLAFSTKQLTSNLIQPNTTDSTKHQSDHTLVWSHDVKCVQDARGLSLLPFTLRRA